MKNEVMVIGLGLLSWGTSTFFSKTNINLDTGLPQAVTMEVPNYDLDADGIRDRDDLIIDFKQLSPKHQGDYALNARALKWDPGTSLTCLDRKCEIKGYSSLVTVPDGGRFVLFHVSEEVQGDFRPWNAGNSQCQPPGDVIHNNLECWADLQALGPDPLLGTGVDHGLPFPAIHVRP